MESEKYRAYVHSENKIFSVSTLYINNDGVKQIEIVGRIKPVWAINAGRTEYIPTNKVMPSNFTLLRSTHKKDREGNLIFEGDLIQKDAGYGIYTVSWNNELLQWQASGMALGLMDDYKVVGNKYEEIANA